MKTEPDILEIQVGRDLIRFETGVIGILANRCIIVRSGDNMTLVAATGSKQPKDLDFFPLTVDYETKMYAVGRIPGGFIRREGRPPDTAILAARVTDRQIRPLFPDGYRNEVHIAIQLLSSDQEFQPDILGMLGTSVALTLSDIPFDGPTAAIRIGRLDGEWIINPTFQEVEEGELDLIIAGTEDSINMVEAGANVLDEDLMLEAIALGHQEIVKITQQIKAWREQIGNPKMSVEAYKIDERLLAYVAQEAEGEIRNAMSIVDNAARAEQISSVRKALAAKIAEMPDDSDIKQIFTERSKDLGNCFYKLEKHIMRSAILEEGKRIDGRTPDGIREINCQVGLAPRTHGSALFTRGTTQALSLATLGSMSDSQPLDNTDPIISKRYMHQYHFPGYSVGEARALRPPGRREIGHGNLASRALLPVLPDELDFPYALRVVSEITSSNGSTSMASTCASTLTLMDAGVPIKAMVAGVAMGLIKEGDKFAILTDIQGVEDHLGDMDFKVTGTRDGITALQMDIKIDGLPMEILSKALGQAKAARLHILDKMSETLDKPREELSPFAPRIITMQINPEKIGNVIGPGGKVIKEIVEKTGVKIDIDDSGLVFIVTPDGDSAKAAQDWITSLTEECEVGKTYEGTVARLTTFGAFIEVLPRTDGLLHISKVPGRPRHIEDVFSMGEKVLVKVDEIDSQGRVNLALAQEVTIPEDAPRSPEHGDRDRGDRGDRPRGGDRDRGDRPRGGGGDRDRGDRPRGGGGDRDRGDRPRNGGGGNRRR